MSEASQQIRITILPEGVQATARLLEQQAPATSRALWKQLKNPLELKGTHAMWTGPEISLQIPAQQAISELSEIPPENLTIFPQPGWLVWAFMQRHAFGGRPEPLYDIGIFYGPMGRIFLPVGWVPCNHFALLQDDWNAFGEACRRTLSEGSRVFRFERVEK